MRSIRTPERIAKEVLGADALAGIGYERHIPYMVRAIEHDRAQRTDETDSIAIVHAAAERWLAELNDYIIPGANDDEAPELQAEANRLQDALATLDGAGATL